MNLAKIGIILLLSVTSIVCLAQAQAASSSDDSFTLQEKIKIYRQILKDQSDPGTLAEAHFKIAGFLEALGKDNEATAEYLKVILNYPEQKELAEVSENKLSALYGKFSKKESDILQGSGERSEDKDPAIFFTYLKSLYEAYIDQGEYDVAADYLRRLIKMDSSNEAYYEDLGNIYLNGYNDPDSALIYFTKLTEMNPDHPKVYTDMGLAYEKKGDFPSAIKFYRKAIERSPYNSWSMYGLSRIQALNLASEKKLIKDWYFLGPFDNKGRKGLSTDMGPEKDLDTSGKYQGFDGRTLEWFRPFSSEDSGYVDLNSLFTPNDMVTVYAMTFAYSPTDRTLELRIGADDPVALYFNGQMVFKDETGLKPAHLDRDVVEVKFRKGWNTILLKSAETFGSFGFYFRLTDEAGNTPLDVIVDPSKNTENAKKMIGKLVRQKGFKIARMTLLLGISAVIFISGLYLMISNIYNKIQIRQMKEDFIASVSHELKTPLAAIKMFAETLNMGRIKDPVKVKDYYSTIIRETDRLTRFINKILDFQKIEKGKKIYSFDTVDVNELLRKAVDIYKNQVQDDTVVWEDSYAPDLPKIELDEDAMLQVFINLVINGYKYSPGEKYIKVETSRLDNGVLVSISDHGIGIPRDKLTKIFDKFYRVERDASKDIKGSGIGLAFVKSVIEAHGGKIGVESQLNKGSTFKIFLPLERGV